MKQFIKNGEIYKSPVKIISENDKIIITNDEKLLLKYGYSIYVPPVHQISVNEKIKDAERKLNRICDRKILNDFVWNGNEFYLSLENQFNFKNLYDLRDIKEYPVTIKTKTGFTTLNSSEEVTDFYLAGVTFIETCLHECWTAKTQAAEQITMEFNKEGENK